MRKMNGKNWTRSLNTSGTSETLILVFWVQTQVSHPSSRSTSLPLRNRSLLQPPPVQLPVWPLSPPQAWIFVSMHRNSLLSIHSLNGNAKLICLKHYICYIHSNTRGFRAPYCSENRLQGKAVFGNGMEQEEAFPNPSGGNGSGYDLSGEKFGNIHQHSKCAYSIP